MNLEGPVAGVGADCERILRTLPRWFGIEAALLEYVADADVSPTFVARVDGGIAAFITLRRHFDTAWEVHCMAVDAACRGRGIGRALHRHVESWLAAQGARVLQVKTMAEPTGGPEYAQTRAFYAAIGYQPLEVFPLLWGPRLPVLQLVKLVRNQG